MGAHNRTIGCDFKESDGIVRTFTCQTQLDGYRVHKSDRRKDRWTEGQTDGKTDRRTDDRHFYVLPKLRLRRTINLKPLKGILRREIISFNGCLLKSFGLVWSIIVLFWGSEGHVALDRNPGPGYDTLLLWMIPGDLLSAFPHRQFHTLPGLLNSWAALPNSYPNAICTIFMMVFGMTRPRGELTTYRARGGHATDWANPTRFKTFYIWMMMQSWKVKFPTQCFHMIIFQSVKNLWYGLTFEVWNLFVFLYLSLWQLVLLEYAFRGVGREKMFCLIIM